MRKKYLGLLNNKLLLLATRMVLRLHSMTYHAAAILATKIEPDHLHPKHRIMQYHQYFLNHIEQGDSVIDIGCGNGALTYDIATKAKCVVGIDINEQSIALARKEYARDNITYCIQDCTELHLHRQFDVVVLSNVIEHIDNRVPFLKVCASLAPRLLVRAPMSTRSWIDMYKKELGVEYRLDKTHFIEYRLEEFVQELDDAGLKLLSHEIQYGEIWAVATKSIDNVPPSRANTEL